MKVPIYHGMIENASVYGLPDSVKASKYPMQTCTAECTDEITKVTHKLATAEKGSGHDNFLNGIIVQFDLTFSVKAWTEMQRYHFIDFVSSQSTMHRIAKFDLDTSYSEYTDDRIIEVMQDLVKQYNADPTDTNYLKLLYSNPCGFKLTARMTTNYRQLKTIYSQRHNHRLPEWRRFCDWIENALPFGAQWLAGGCHEENKQKT